MKRIILISILIVFGSLTGSPFSIENLEINAHDLDMLDTFRADSAEESVNEDVVVIYLEEVQEPMAGFGIEQFFNGNNSAKPSEVQNTVNEKDVWKTDLRHELTKIRTEIKSVEKILKKAVIKTHCVNGRIEGLQLYGLNKVSEAKALLLKSGDIIVAVNGHTLSSKKEAYNIFKKARKQPKMIVELLQDGKTKKLLFDFQGAV